MAMSIQTNVNSLISQENLRVNSDFQAKTIQRLTSGYRINQSGDDAAGLAVANKFRSDTTELTQGVRNANDGVSQLQIIDGGLSNISQMLDRMKTLATQSASTTFTGDRTTLNNEYQALTTEIDRQAANIGLNSGGTFNTNINVFIGGGGSNQSNSQISIDLSGAANTIDATGLGVKTTNLLGAGTTMSTNAKDLNNSGNVLSGAGNTQTFNLYLAGDASAHAVVVTGGTGGISATDALQQLNNGLSAYGVSAYIDQTSGNLVFAGSKAFSIVAGAASGGAATGMTSNNSSVANYSMYHIDKDTGGAAAGTAAAWATLSAGETETFTFTVGGASQGVQLQSSDDTLQKVVSKLNSTLSAIGVSALVDQNGTGVAFQSASDFTMTSVSTSAAAKGVIGGSGNDFTGQSADNASAASVTGNATSALTAINNAVSSLGLVQGRIGTGQNKLQYAINLAQSQIASFSAAQSRIRDADIAAEAANLTKASTLSQASMAAMAQANSAPQQVLSLLRG